MPVKSKAQARKFFELHKQGKISDATLAEWTSGVEVKHLPEHVKRSGSSDKNPRHPLAFNTSRKRIR